MNHLMAGTGLKKLVKGHVTLILIIALALEVTLLTWLLISFTMHGTINAGTGTNGGVGGFSVVTINSAQCPVVIFNYTLTLPNKFSVIGYYGKILNEGIGTNVLSKSTIGRSSDLRIAWHMASLTIVFGDNVSDAEESWFRATGQNMTICRITYTVRTQVLEIKANNTWIEIPPTAIEGNYTTSLIIEASKGINVSQVMEVIKRLTERPVILLPPIKNLLRIPPLNISLPQPSINISNLPLYANPPKKFIEELIEMAKNLTLPPGSLANYQPYTLIAQTWALSAFADISSNMSEICGWVYPVNGSDLVLPSGYYASTPLSVWQGGYVYGYPVTFLIQGVAQIWPPELVYNVWVSDPGIEYLTGGQYIGYVWIGNMTLTSPADWLGEGVYFCISINQTSANEYTITINGYVGTTQYEMASIDETLNGPYSTVTVTPGNGFTQSLYGIEPNNTLKPLFPLVTSPLTEQVPMSSINEIGSVHISSAVLYPSMAFETSDASPSFYSNNENFALYFEMGPNSLVLGGGPGNWPLYYSISGDVRQCPGIWGSSDVGSQWPPSTSQWGASGGFCSEGGLVSYTAAVGSISQLNNVGLHNTVGISCQYVDEELTNLNQLPCASHSP